MSLDDLTNTSGSSDKKEAAKSKRSLSWLLPLSLLCGFLLIFYLLFGDRLRPAIAVETAPVVTIRSQSVNAQPQETKNGKPTKGQLLFQASGWVEPAPYTTHVPTLIDGVVQELHALEGQAVKKGDLLATLIDEDARLNLATVEKKLTSLKKQIEAHCSGFDVLDAEKKAIEQMVRAKKAELDNASDRLARLKSVKRGVVSQQSVVQAENDVVKQEAILAETESKLPKIKAQRAALNAEKLAMEAKLEELSVTLEKAQLALARTKIYAPMNGVVLQLHAAPGKKRMLNMDSPTSATIVELYNPKKLQARIDVALNEAAALSVGQPVELISDLLPDQVFKGVVTRVTGQADIQRNTIQAKIEIENPDSRLRPEMLIRAKFFQWSSNSPSVENKSSTGRLSLYVPEKAIVNDSQVWVISNDSTAELRNIKLSAETRDDHRLVLEGLQSGELVILPPFNELEEGARVKQNTKH